MKLSFHRLLFLSATLFVFLAQPMAGQAGEDLTGTWRSNMGPTYNIVRTDEQFAWTDSTGGKGTIAFTPDGLAAKWTDAAGPHSATGKIIEYDADGFAVKISWSNGVVFQKSGPSRRQGASPQFSKVDPNNLNDQPNQPPGEIVLSPRNSTMQNTGNVPVSLLPVKAIYLRVPGKLHPGGPGIPLQSFGMGIDSSYTSPTTQSAQSSGSASSPTVRLDVSKSIDISSPLLMQATASGEFFPEAFLEVFGENILPPILILKLSNVRFTAYRLNVSQVSNPPFRLEEVSIAFEKIEYLIRMISEESGRMKKVESTGSFSLEKIRMN